MQLLQVILCFIDIKLWHNIKNSLFAQENELFHQANDLVKTLVHGVIVIFDFSRHVHKIC